MPPPSPKQAALRALIEGFISQRLADKLQKIAADDDAKRQELQQQYAPHAWLEDAARRVSQIQAVTHSLKPIHPDAKGSSLYCPPDQQPRLREIGTHHLGADFALDVVGNAAALDVYKFLKLTLEEKTFLDLAKENDVDFSAALSDNIQHAQNWMNAFSALSASKGKLTTHTFAKQIYWRSVDDDSHDNLAYHLLAPLYPTSLIHRIYNIVQENRFGEDTKAAREARKAEQFHAQPIHEYKNLLIQKLGGTKPQNISQLNSERGGNNYLFASLPPTWKSQEIRPLNGVSSLFKRFENRPFVKHLYKALQLFLNTDPTKNLATRNQRKEYVESLIDELIQFNAELQEELTPAWSQAPECKLPLAQRVWLDPSASEAFGDLDPTLKDPEVVAEQVAADFANWLNKKLRDASLPVGDPEFFEWRDSAKKAFKFLA
jgi:CRISPR-associated protein Csy1